MIGVVEFQIGDQTQPGAELHQRAIALIGLGYQQFAAAMVTIAAEGRHHAADHGGGILAGGRQQGGHQGAGGGFAVAAGHGDGGLAVDQGSQHIGAVAHGQSEAADLQQFRIAGRYGGADHHQRRLGGAAADGGHRGRVLFPEHAHAKLAQLVHHLALARIRPTHRVAPLGQDPGQGRHADAPHTDEVERLVAIKRGDQGRLRSRGGGPAPGGRNADCVEIRPYGTFGYSNPQRTAEPVASDSPRCSGSAGASGAAGLPAGDFCMIGAQISPAGGSHPP